MYFKLDSINANPIAIYKIAKYDFGIAERRNNLPIVTITIMII